MIIFLKIENFEFQSLKKLFIFVFKSYFVIQVTNYLICIMLRLSTFIFLLCIIKTFKNFKKSLYYLIIFIFLV